MVPCSSEVARTAIENICPGAKVAIGFCDCGITTVLVCTLCGNTVLYLTVKGKWCPHAEKLRQGSIGRWQR
jgi:hypothetical protein